MEWIRDFVKRRMDSQEAVCAGRVFEPHPFWGETADGKQTRTAFYRPTSYQKYKPSSYLLDLDTLVRAEREASLLRRAIVDEFFPVEERLVGKKKEYLFAGGRYWDIILLGMIKYKKAIPELIEVARHDLHSNLKSNALEAIRKMDSAAFNYSGLITDILFEEKDILVRIDAAETIGKIGNVKEVKRIRDVLQEARIMAKTTMSMGYFRENNLDKRNLCHNSATLFEKLLISLYQLDRKEGMEEIMASFRSGCSLVRHHTKNAIFWAGADRLIYP